LLNQSFITPSINPNWGGKVHRRIKTQVAKIQPWLVTVYTHQERVHPEPRIDNAAIGVNG
jgi:hypothetical protein